ncbi:hypothetical protein DRN73_07115, partial [Candidatus Pacearchaeota archaeon]
IPKTLIPVNEKIYEIISRYKKILFVEENAPGLYKKLLFGEKEFKNIYVLNKIGYMISPSEIIFKVEKILNS